MRRTSIALFNNKGGVGKTTLAYHMAHMMSRLGQTVLAVDFDPQANLTAYFLDEEHLDRLWDRPTDQRRTIAGAVDPIVEGVGDIRSVDPIEVAEQVHLLPGDLALSSFEEKLAKEWPSTLAGGDNAAARATTALYRVAHHAAEEVGADVVLIDVGPNLGALNRAALLAAERVLIPLGADLFSVQGLRNLGPALGRWRKDWQQTALPRMNSTIATPGGQMQPLGYVVMQPSMRLDRPVKAYQRWLTRIPQVYMKDVLGAEPGERVSSTGQIATIRNFRSLMPLAHDARKPMFDLRAADGAVGSTSQFVQVCYDEFRNLSETVLDLIDSSDPLVATSPE